MASLVSIISGVITADQGYKNLFVILLPFQIVGLLGTIFFLPESQFNRAPHLVVAAESGNDKMGDKDVELYHEETVRENSAGEKDTPTRQTTRNYAPKKTYIQSLAPYTKVYTDRNIFLMFGEIFIHLLNPAVVWILFTSAIMVVSKY